MPDTILVVDDEEPIAEILEYNLRKAGYETEAAYDGEKALSLFKTLQPDLILLDIMLPGRNGIEVCEQIRQESAIPVLMLTAKDAEDDVVEGLNAGADDYITKPFSPREVLARIEAQLRRTKGLLSETSRAEDDGQLVFGRLQIDLNRFQVFINDEDVGLTRREFELLAYLAKNVNKVITREQLLAEVWGYEYYGDVRTVDVTVRRLREKIEEDPSEPHYVVTRRGVGYIFTGEDDSC